MYILAHLCCFFDRSTWVNPMELDEKMYVPEIRKLCINIDTKLRQENMAHSLDCIERISVQRPENVQADVDKRRLFFCKIHCLRFANKGKENYGIFNSSNYFQINTISIISFFYAHTFFQSQFQRWETFCKRNPPQTPNPKLFP